MLPAERGEVGEELVRDILSLAQSGNGAIETEYWTLRISLPELAAARLAASFRISVAGRAAPPFTPLAGAWLWSNVARVGSATTATVAPVMPKAANTRG